ncbi:NUDIX hydrolase [Methanocella sp. MCL-LM]|uniref:NUDIX hydrolase n=1 Tax=Methanocella sp. MCL-LM TaxID=3412035 RepID=UPI003C73D39D
MTTERFVVGCGAVIVNSSGMILMVRQMKGYWADKWIFPGGKLEMGETLEACVHRETLEETTCLFEIERQVGAYISYDPQTSFEKQVVLIYFLGRYTSGIPTVGDGVSDTKWLTPEKIEEMAAKGEVPAILIRILHDALRLI